MRRRRYRRTMHGKTFLFLLFLLLGLLIFNHQVKPVMQSVTENEAKVKAVNMINDMVLKELEKDSVTYDSLVTINRSADGSVQYISTNMVKMNLLKAQVINAIQNGLNSDSNTTVGVPLGTLFGGSVFHGIGPDVALHLTLSGNAAAEFKSNFESAGINQTKHQIYLIVSASVYSFLPGVDTTTDVKTNILVAETVIVGSVPQVVADFK